VIALIGPRGWIVAEAGEIAIAASAPGVIGGAVIKAARRSAGLSRRNLASAMAVDLATVRDWESGVRPLFCVSYHELCQLAQVLERAGARVGHKVDELVLASQCDLLITGMLRGFEDYAEVPNVNEDVAGDAARSLLRWALIGQVPERYRPYAQMGRLVTERDASLFDNVARDLQEGSHGDDIARYGTALIALITPRVPDSARGDTYTKE